MYRFPNRDSVASLVGKRLEEISCHANTIDIGFGYKLFIVIMTESLRVTKVGTTIKVGIPINRLQLFDFLEKTVTSINIRDDKRVMELVFEDGDTILLEDDADIYESYIININGKEFIV